jgi:RHH-type proline utilization regulon transcriptional repressor/proline dehydrogenase/delta 1-pyrroline-5-carboxylate dehydrogenase
VQRFAALAQAEGRILASGDGSRRIPSDGWFCEPVLAAELPPESEVLHREIFGPLLTLERVRDVEHALEVVDSLPVALTGGLFTRNPTTVRLVRERTPVGNLYVNRGITGAMVGRQPFGGNRLSGTGTKAGGPDYVLQFVEPRAVTENTMRHGLEV